MKIQVGISAVDGDTHRTLITPDVQTALDFVSSWDHEGSSLSVIVEAYNDDVFRLLTQLRIFGR